MNYTFDIRDFDIIGPNGQVVGNWIGFGILFVAIGALVIRKIIHVRNRKAGLPVSYMEKRKDRMSFARKYSMIEDTLGSSESAYIPKKETAEDKDLQIARLEKELAEAKKLKQNDNLGE